MVSRWRYCGRRHAKPAPLVTKPGNMICSKAAVPPANSTGRSFASSPSNWASTGSRRKYPDAVRRKNLIIGIIFASALRYGVLGLLGQSHMVFWTSQASLQTFTPFWLRYVWRIGNPRVVETRVLGTLVLGTVDGGLGSIKLLLGFRCQCRQLARVF